MKKRHACALAGLLLPAMAWGQLLVSAADGLPNAPEPQPYAQQPSSSSNVNPAPTAIPERRAPVPCPALSSAVPMSPSSSAAKAPRPNPGDFQVGTSANEAAAASTSAPLPGAAVAPVPTSPCETPSKNPFHRFLSVSAPDGMTAKQKLVQSGKDVIDPFNLITIGGLSALYVMQNARSDYGPGMEGFAKNAGVSLTQGMTGEFFGTFLIPALTHEDPRYHRMPHAKLGARIGHVLIQAVITQGDNGRPMFNYSNFPGFLIEDEISNLYVPMRHTNLESTAARVSIGLATVPIGNAITEFLPDVARHINFNVVFLQRIIDQVSGRDGTMNNN